MPDRRTNSAALAAAAICLTLGTLLVLPAFSPVRTCTSVNESPPAPWPQFGGPHRDFTTETTHPSLNWPDDGPTRLWARPLGDGYSGIVADESRLFTMYREQADEIVIVLDPETGKTTWQYRYPAPIDPVAQLTRYGVGPRSTPLLVRGRSRTTPRCNSRARA